MIASTVRVCKLARAQHQLKTIEDAIDAYWDRKPVFPVGKLNEDSTEYTMYLRVVEPPDVLWGVMFGEAIHNMRSALDHAVYQLTFFHSGKTKKGTGFPIFVDPDVFAEKGRPQIRGIPPNAQTYIERLQPYTDPKPKDTNLWTLQSSWNQEKHRAIPLMTALPKDSVFTIHPPVPCHIQIFEGLKEDGAKLAHVVFEEPSPHVKVRLEATMQIVDKTDWDSNDNATITYEELLGEVSEIIGRLLSYIID